MNRRHLLAHLVTGAAALPAASSLVAQTQVTQTKRNNCGAAPGNNRRSQFSNVVLTNQYGEKNRFYDDLIKDKIVIVNFFYTHCEERCPVYTMNLAKVQRLLGDRVGRDVFMYSITLTPDHDTTTMLKQYADKYNVKPGWFFLTGSPGDVELVRRRLKFTDSDPKVDQLKTSHLGMIRYGNDKLDRWSACSAIANPAEIVKYMSWLELPKVPAGKRSPGAVRETARNCTLLG